MDSSDERLRSHVRPAGWRNPDPARIYDLVVIGGGTAGLVCAAGAAGLGARVALIERALLGGDCLNTGCVPSKSLIRSARLVHEARRSASAGVRADIEVDFAAVMARVRERRADIAPHDSATRLASLGVDVFFGNATFSGPRSVAVDGGALHFKRAVIATGSRPAIPEAFGTTGIYTSENIFELTEQPRQMLVAGGGPVGCELAQAFALLGTRVTLVEQSGRILPGDDPDAAAILAKVLVEDGVSLETGVRADPQRAPGAVLVAAGRLPNIEGLGLDAAGVAAGAAGITVDDQLRTTNRRVFAAGDVCSRFKFTHAADAMARIVVQNALFFGRRRASALVIPSCTYTLPEIARVGSVAGPHVTIRLDDVDRAIVDDAREGFVRIHHEDGRITGATIVAPHAGELIGYVASAMRHGHSLDAFSSDVFPYPTLAEALRKAGDTYRRGRLTRPVRRLLGGYFGMRKLWP